MQGLGFQDLGFRVEILRKWSINQMEEKVVSEMQTEPLLGFIGIGV